MRILNILLLAVLALSFSGCSNEEKLLFDRSAAERIDQTVADYRTVLESAPNGWKLQYLLGRDYSGSTVTMMVTFKNGKATMASDVEADTLIFDTADYNVVKDQGPVLTFDTYLAPLHDLAAGRPGRPEGLQGDYEFSILSATADTVRLRGKKWKNDMLLTRNAPDVNLAAYLKASMAMRGNIIMDSVRLTCGTDTIAGAGLESVIQHLNITSLGDKSIPYIFTPEGFDFVQPLTYKGRTYSHFVYNDSTKTFADGDMVLSFKLPDNYKRQSFWIGKWSIKHAAVRAIGRRPTYLTIYDEPSPRNAQALRAVLTYNNLNYELFVMYDRTTGYVTIPPQDFNDPEGKYSLILLLGVGSKHYLGKVNDPVTFQWDEEQGMALPIFGSADGESVEGLRGIGFKDPNTPATDANGNYVIPILMDDIEHMRKVQ